ncbi:ABC transporter ATP-binding protein [bacterium]|nr:ABC transporter ATP-binding protein [bacterium]
MAVQTAQPLLEVKDLQTHFYTMDGASRAVDKVSFHVHAGETLGLVGESGCGKSVTSLSILRLIPTPPGRIMGGEIIFKGANLLDLPERRMCAIRGDEISMIFQEPMTSLNPVFTVGYQIAEVYRIHRGMSTSEAMQEAVKMLELVRISAPAQRIHEYPHQMSGGMRQRVMIAMALACNPKLLIADEPTTALDVTVQAQILALMNRLKEERKSAIILITHNLAVVAEMADRVAVMYAGEIVEERPVERIFSDPLHPYTQGLLRSIPSTQMQSRKLHVIEGTVPSASKFPPGCRFAPRCQYRFDRCDLAHPQLLPHASGGQVRCFLYEK